MYKVIIMNSTGGNKEGIFRPETTICEIVENPEYASVLGVSGCTLAFGATILTPSDYAKSLRELGASTDGVNVLNAIKAANGAA